MKILLNQDELDAGVERLAREINETYGNRPLTIVGVLTGSFILMAMRCFINALYFIFFIKCFNGACLGNTKYP